MDRIKRDSMMVVMEVVYLAGNVISCFMSHLSLHSSYLILISYLNVKALFPDFVPDVS